MRNFTLLLILIFTFNSCVYRHTEDIIDLGSKYYFLPDGRMSTIGYNTAEEGENRSGIEMVEPKVVKYSFNNKYIIAKSVGALDKEVKYWIIDKGLTKKNMPISLDSISFYEELLNKKIELNLE